MRLTTLALATLLTACASAPAPHTVAAAPQPVDVPQVARPDGETAAWWYRAGAARAAGNGAMQGRARNVIIFLGDGMSLPTVAAARVLAGQRAGNPGEETMLAFEQFPNTALSRTYNTDYQTPDSAGTMTAIATGVKTRLGVIGIGPGNKRGDCAAVADNTLLSIIELGESAGLSTGVVTTTRLTHATPASVFAHGPDRNWEDDSYLPAAKAAAGCRDLAAQFVDFGFGDGIDVALAGGRAKFTPNTLADAADPKLKGMRKDGRNLVDEWKAKYADGTYVWNSAQLAQAANAPRVLGLFAPQHLPYTADRKADAQEPPLAEMTRAAIAHLQRNDKGFVLLVEGGRIDHAHHDGNARRALEETIAFSDAVQAADEATGDDDTLILVTADHAHTMFFAGYPKRGNPILDKVRGISGEDSSGSEYAVDKNGQPYTTLGYANGPGAPKAGEPRPDLDDIDTEAVDYLQQALVPLGAETHGGDDVGVWAKGPGADAVRGSVEENVLFHFLVQATPTLRERLCAAGTCNADGVPVELPKPADFKP
ncbi:Alkaline phosphatase [Lysobacter dokdonensis DS-58]|uniref:Alkaline phosphatase n=1 Tax=Lysobacter dokdonensis DS-58 TaxID=1300345 RepID=A0A0A2WHE6_9GAMM|nr:alkaline phosphatase [Lysobacter dokdonensis]KGQ19621.1 Alkaline phosphatase [Lysobacter dokdonensis DS-58]